MQARELVEQIVRAQAGALCEHAQTPTDSEHIHQARVATRRLRAALRVFKELLPPEADALGEDLKWIAQQLGAVRDLDVQLARLHTHAAQLCIEPYQRWLQARREQALAACVDALGSPRFVHLTDQLHDFAPGAGDLQLEDYAPQKLRAAMRKLRKRARRLNRDSTDAEFHQVRIRAKRLRYTAEFFEPLYEKPARKLIAACTQLQDLLGDQQDGIVATVHVREAARIAAAWPPDAILALGQLVQWEADHRADIRRHFKRSYGDVERAWSKLGKSL